MWSGPRNLSTAMMRAFGNRRHVVAVLDEPFYAAYLAATGKAHPMRDAVLAAGPTDWREAARRCAPPARGVLYQKHMAQHMLPGFGRDWMDALTHVFLIRDPARVVASFAAKWEEVESEDLGFDRQLELFERVAERQGAAPPVIDAERVRADPEGVLRALCARIGLGFDAGMLAWPAGRRESDGVWGAHWYGSVERSTGFAPPEPEPPPLAGRYAALAAAGEAAYERLSAHAC
jgi:Sulfotransferase domain